MDTQQNEDAPLSWYNLLPPASKEKQESFLPRQYFTKVRNYNQNLNFERDLGQKRAPGNDIKNKYH